VIAEFRVEGVLMLVSECDLLLDAVDRVELLGESPVLTAVLGASDVGCVPVDVEDLDGELVDAAGDLVEVRDEESDGSARASPCPESTAAPTPSVTIRPANRPISRTASLTSDASHDNNLAGEKSELAQISAHEPDPTPFDARRDGRR
jgi:hypothetical protein